MRRILKEGGRGREGFSPGRQEGVPADDVPGDADFEGECNSCVYDGFIRNSGGGDPSWPVPGMTDHGDRVPTNRTGTGSRTRSWDGF